MTTLTSPYAPPIQPSRWKLIRGYLRRNKSLLVGLLILLFLILFLEEKLEGLICLFMFLTKSLLFHHSCIL